MQESKDSTGKKYFNSIGWIVGKTLIISYYMLRLSIKIGMAIISSQYKSADKKNLLLPVSTHTII